jgi:hypothetical protein
MNVPVAVSTIERLKGKFFQGTNPFNFKRITCKYHGELHQEVDNLLVREPN